MRGALAGSLRVINDILGYSLAGLGQVFSVDPGPNTKDNGLGLACKYLYCR